MTRALTSRERLPSECNKGSSCGIFFDHWDNRAGMRQMD
jgi:hypothetical protein